MFFTSSIYFTPVILKPFFHHTSLKSFSFFSILPDFKYAVKTSVFIGKCNDQTFHVVGRVRARARLEI